MFFLLWMNPWVPSSPTTSGVRSILHRLILMSTSFQIMHLGIKKIHGKHIAIGLMGLTFVLSSAHWALLRLSHAFPGAPHSPVSRTAWRRSSGRAAWLSSRRGAVGLSCSSTPVEASPSQDIPIPQTFSSFWQIPQCPDPDYRILPLMKVPEKLKGILL